MSTKRDPDYILPDSPTSPAYIDALKRIEALPPDEALNLMRYIATNDLWFFGRFCTTSGQVICDDPHNEHFGKPWLDHPWLFERCREQQLDGVGYLDLWPRFHWKSTICTFIRPMWELINNSNLCVIIFTWKVAGTGKTFLKQIKKECEINPRLHQLWPEVFWKDPNAESSTWNNEELVFKRDLNPREPSLTVCSLEGSQPVSQHYDIMIYDDIVTRDNITPDLIKKTNNAWQQSSALGKANTRKWYVGTRWHVADTWDFIIKEGVVDLRRHDVYDSAGVPVLYSNEWIEGCNGCDKCGNRSAGVRKELGRYNFWSQIRNEPIAEGDQVFELGWLRWYDIPPEKIAPRLNTYIFVDTARITKKETADYTAIAVVGIGAGEPRPGFYLLDLIRDRITLPETTELLFALVAEWKPRVVFVEQIGAMRDVEHIKYVAQSDGKRINIMECHEKIRKEERIRRLQHYLEMGDWFLPKRGILRRSDGDYKDMVQVLKEEEMKDWTPSGSARHDDMLDVLSWVHSPAIKQHLIAPVWENDFDYKGRRNKSASKYFDSNGRPVWAI